MDAFLQNVVVVAALVLAAGYLVWAYVKRKQRAGCPNCQVNKLVQGSRDRAKPSTRP